MRKLNNFGFSHVLIPVLVFVMLGAIGGAYLLSKSGASPAPATTTTSTTVTPSVSFTVGSTVHICLNSAQNECIAANGPGGLVRIQTTGNAWKVKQGQLGGLMFQNGSGNCLKTISGSASTGVTVSSGACVSGNDSETWGYSTLDTNLPTFQNGLNGGYMNTTYKTAGSVVNSNLGSAIPGHFYKWVAK